MSRSAALLLLLSRTIRWAGCSTDRLEPPPLWEVIGRRALEEQLTRPVVQFMQDRGDFRRCTIFDTAGHERAAEPQECVGLERAAVWERDSVEQRLLDTFLGRPNADAEHLKVRLH